MPFLMFGSKTKVKLVPDGNLEKRRCPECGKTTIFRECVAKKEYNAYRFVKLWDSTSTVYVCESCSEWMPLSETLAPELSPREKAQQRELAAAEARISTKRREVAAIRAEKAEREKHAMIDAELEALKRRLGK